jgi:glycosyltransferase involved in cell wall biosynthesis
MWPLSGGKAIPLTDVAALRGNPRRLERRNDQVTGTVEAEGVVVGQGLGGAEALPASAPPFVSVCMLTRGRPKALDECLLSLQRQVGAPLFELLVGCHADEAAAQIVRERFPSATIGVFDDANPGGARNELMKRAQGELLLFLDDDVVFAENLLAVLAELAEQHPEISVFGGPNLTPPHSSLIQGAQGVALGSLYGSGPVRRRYGVHPPGVADERSFTCCNLAVRRGAAVPFAPQLAAAEENAMLKELEDGAQLMWYDPRFFVYHERRRTFRSFAAQMGNYGRGRGQAIFHQPRSFRLAYFVPVALVLWLVSVPVVSLLWSPWWSLTTLVYAAFLSVAGVDVARQLRPTKWRQRVRTAAVGAFLTATIHVCYGVGIVRGLIRRPPTPRTTWTNVADRSDATAAVQSASL